ncbi:hypothetical protein T484DRAFT_1785487, partial [Baffinella frigidus]
MASEAGAAPASDETGAPENRVTPASQNGPDAAVRRKKKASDPPTAWTTPAFVPAGAPENRARPASQDDPGEEAGAQVHEVSGIGASTGFSTGAEVKVPNEIVPKRREGGIGTFAGAVRVGQQHLQASKEKETTLQADKERNKVQEDALKGRALKLESQENDLKDAAEHGWKISKIAQKRFEDDYKALEETLLKVQEEKKAA